MHSDFFSQLPATIQELVVEIEEFARLEIGVELNAKGPSPTDPNPDALGLRATENEGTILLRDLDEFPAQAVLHELLHLHRFWNQGVPQIIPKSDPDGDRYRVTGQIENALEHLIIVPQEEEYGFEPYEYWNRTAKKNWGRYPWPKVASSWARRKNCLLGWLTLKNLVTDPSIREIGQEAIREEGHFAVAEKFDEKIQRVIGNKERMIRNMPLARHVANCLL